jgi:predicted GH43/DUF377 family glycosyl hydrolase
MQIFLLFAFSIFLVNAKQDLEKKTQDFVLETKQIHLPEFPHAFNPSLVRWGEGLLLSFRVIPDAKQPFTSWLGVVRLDDNFNVVSAPQIITLRYANSPIPSRIDDGRLIIFQDSLYVVYSDNEDEYISKGGFRVYIARLEEKNGNFEVMYREKLSTFAGNNTLRREKNWTPFILNDTLFLAYSLSPHLILKPIFGTNTCITTSCSTKKITWRWGELRGGTPALLMSDHYLGFFHSCMMLETVHCPKKARHYFMGAYTFNAERPFEITHISKEPIIGKNFYHGPSYPPYWGTVQVVFPGGFIYDEQFIWVVFGRQDHEMWVTKLDKNGVYQHLVPTESKSFDS